MSVVIHSAVFFRTLHDLSPGSPSNFSRVPRSLEEQLANLARLDPIVNANQGCVKRVSRLKRRAWKEIGLRPLKQAMILRKTNPPFLHLATASPEDSPRCSSVFSDCDADDEATMSAEEAPSTHSHPPSESLNNFSAAGPYCPRIPTLQEVLRNSAPPPWTLGAFTAYLSQNHCLETLEFVMDAERYRKRYDTFAGEMAGMPMTPDVEECDEVRRLWNKLIDAYIIPDSPREVNLPSDVRDRLLSLPSHTSPPPPDELSHAVQMIYELMDESVLMPFINELSPSRDPPSFGDVWNDSDENLPMRVSFDETTPSSHPRRKHSPPLTLLEGFQAYGSPTLNRLSQHLILSHGFNKGRLMTQPSSASITSADPMLTDDSGSPSSPHREPMTPPTTPPSSEMGGSSPRNRGDNTWKKMMGRLGSKKKSTSRMGRIEDEGTD